MDMYRAFLAIAISFVILIGYQYLFVAPAIQEQAQNAQTQQPQAPIPQAQPEETSVQPGALAPVPSGVSSQPLSINPEARDIAIDTPLYHAIMNEQGGGLKSFTLKNYRQKKELDAQLMDLVKTSELKELPLLFTLDNGQAQVLPVYRSSRESLSVTGQDSSASLEMKASFGKELELTRSLKINSESYLIEVSYLVKNISGAPVQISPAMSLTNSHFSEDTSTNPGAGRLMFSGPAALVGTERHEVKGADLEEGPKTLQGAIKWAAYEDHYFLFAAIPEQAGDRTLTMSGNDDKVRTVISEGTEIIPSQGEKSYTYQVYIGPKKLTYLNDIGFNLSEAVNFGWFDVIAKPMLWLLNFFHNYIGNYGIAIILLTISIKLIFWPITQKGMKSMKNMQKLQPKVAKLKEKYKDDSQRMNQEMMALYKSYKVNPLGGCLPMFLQIPFFFALYKVLLMSIELRHAPFMLWIDDLAAPDRLWLGFDIPYLHGLPVLTILMGASMFLQQKMTPTTADPTQARIMQMLPIIFTFMFLNFASGLVLYWFVNNLLSILQQQLINRQTKA